MTISESDRQVILGALDSAGVALAGHAHEWTIGERTIYDEAIRIITVEHDVLRIEFGKPKWNYGEDGSLSRTAHKGDIWIEARIVEGGNGRWTPWIHKYRLGRPKKRGSGRIASTILVHKNHPQHQTDTRDQAIAWCDEEWDNLCPPSL